MQSYGISGISDSEIDEDLKKTYGGNENHLKWAVEVGKIAGDFTRQTPVGALKSSKSDKQARREYRRKCRDYIKERVYSELKPQEKKPEDTGDPQVVGFIGSGFIMMAILSGIIQYFVRKLMVKYFGSDEE